MLSTVPDQGECVVCSPPQAVAQVMIQSFQLSSCALFNAQMQDVSVHQTPQKTLLRSVSLRLWPILRHERRVNRDRIVCDGPRYLFILLLCFECNACEHGRCRVVVMCFCSGPPPLFSVLLLLLHSFLSATSPQTSRISSSLSLIFIVQCLSQTQKSKSDEAFLLREKVTLTTLSMFVPPSKI